MTKHDDSYVEVGPSTTSYVGPDAVALFRANALRAGIRLYAETGLRPSRVWTPSAMLKAAGRITGKTYKRGRFDEAIADLTVWIETMKLALPVEVTEIDARDKRR